MRKLATIRIVDNLTPIPNADRIETAWFGGWTVIVQKGLHEIGKKVMYIEVDSCLPIDHPAFSSLAERGVKEIEGKKYHRLKTIKMKGQISQGFVLPLNVISDVEISDDADKDYSEELGIIKWDPELYSPTACLAGNALRSFPSYLVPKTDEERIQNIPWMLNSDLSFEETLKMDGSSFTAYYCSNDEHPFGICSRNLQLKHEDEQNQDNVFVKIAAKYDIKNKLMACGRNLAIQGEVMGPGIQGNKEKFTELDLFIFNVFDIDNQRELLPAERRKVVADLGLKHVPVLSENVVLSTTFANMEEILAHADGPSLVSNLREGVVFKCNSYDTINGREVVSFKAISNKFLLKNGDD